MTLRKKQLWWAVHERFEDQMYAAFKRGRIGRNVRNMLVRLSYERYVNRTECLSRSGVL